jgi:hypothetical protein
MAMLPCIFLRYHVEQTTEELKTLIAEVERIEMMATKKAEIEELHDQKKPEIEELHDQKKPEIKELHDQKKPEIKELHDQIHQLHACNTRLIKLERRWRFQTQLAASIHEFLDSHRQSQISRHEMNVKIDEIHGGSVSIYNRGGIKEEAFDRTHLQNHPDFKALGNNVGFHKKLIGGAEYDLEVLSRRISNLFTAVSCCRLISLSILLTW